MQNIESNLHLLSSYLTDSEKILAEGKRIPDSKVELILDNIHNSVAKLEELAAFSRKMDIDWKRKHILSSMNNIVTTTDKICKDCAVYSHATIVDIISEVKKHASSLEGSKK